MPVHPQPRAPGQHPRSRGGASGSAGADDLEAERDTVPSSKGAVARLIHELKQENARLRAERDALLHQRTQRGAGAERYGVIGESFVPEALERKMRARCANATVIDPRVDRDQQSCVWRIIDRATRSVYCDNLLSYQDAIFLARAREYVRSLLNELDRLRA